LQEQFLNEKNQPGLWLVIIISTFSERLINFSDAKIVIFTEFTNKSNFAN